MKVQTIYDLTTHSYTLKKAAIGAENCIEITCEQWLKHNQVRKDFLAMQKWILETQNKRSEEWEGRRE